MTDFAEHNGKIMAKVSSPLDRWSLEGPVEGVVAYLLEEAEGTIDPSVDIEISNGYYGESPEAEFTMQGWRNLTQQEIDARAKRKAKDAERRAKEAREKAESKKRKQEDFDRRAIERARELGLIPAASA